MEKETVVNSEAEIKSENTFGEKVGRLIGTVFVACVGACLSAVMIALAVRFITWIF